MITLKALRQMPIGVLETRWIEIDGKQQEYYLVKLSETLYSIGFSKDGISYSHIFGDSTMLTMMNYRQLSDNRAIEIYVTDPHLSPD